MSSPAKPHEAPTFYIPDEASTRRPRAATVPAPVLQRAHTSSRLLHDADVGALDAGYGFYSVDDDDIDDDDAQRRRRRPRSASQAVEGGLSDDVAGRRFSRSRGAGIVRPAGPVRRAITDEVYSRDARVRDIAAAGRKPRWNCFPRTSHAQAQAQASENKAQYHHHSGLLEAIRKDLAADRQEETLAERELAEVRRGGSGQHAFQATHLVGVEDEKAGARDLEAQSVAVPETESDDNTALESEAGGSPPGSNGQGKQEAAGGEEKESDPNLVGWDSPSDLANPRNWSNKKKWLVTTIVSSYTLLSPLSSSMIAPALPILDEEFGITNQIQSVIMLSTFVLAYAIGPLLLGGLSEMYGRLPILQFANLLLIVFTMAGGLAHSSAQMTVFRFFAGLGGSAPLTIGGGIISDLYSPDQRGKAMAVYSLAPLLGPCIGPIVAGWIIQSGVSWRWIFWVVLIASGFVAGFGFLTLPETYAPVILAKKRSKLVKETGNTKLHTIFELQNSETFATRLRRNFIRPFVFIVTQPAVQALSTYMMIVYGTMYVLLSDVDSTFRRTYNEGPGIASLHYISLGLGFTVGGQVGGRVVDRVYRNLKKKNGGVGRPEFKLPFMCAASPLVPAGLLLYGWTIQYAVHWIVPDIGLFLFGVGMMSSFLCTQNFLVDAYQLYAASAVGAAVFLRSVAGFALPLASPALYGNLGNGWGNSVLALIAAAIGIPAPFALYKYGPYLRKKSKYASTSF
ncbi:hypothetical protein OC835_004837 [Tilletia horrida]|nr:hypothetical protein OC835_004837 [Tilletia horrida]